MKRLELLLPLLLCATAWAVTPARTGYCTAQASTCTLSATATGDVQIAFVYRNSATPASVPSGWVSLGTKATTSGGTVGSGVVACHVASSSSDNAIAAFTNGTGISAASYGGTSGSTAIGCAPGIGYVTLDAGKTATTANYAATTEDSTANWFVGLMGGSTTSSCTPIGMTVVQAADNAAPAMRISDSNRAYSGSWPGVTCSITSSTRVTAVVELIAPCQAAGWCADDFVDMNTGSVGNALIPTTLTAGTHGAGISTPNDSWSVTSTGSMVIGAHQTNCSLRKSVLAKGTTYTTSNPSKAVEWNGSKSSEVVSLAQDVGTHYWITVFACVVPTPADAGGSWATADIIDVQNLNGDGCTAQYINGDAGTGVGVHFDLEGNNDNVLTIGGITPGHPYAVVLGCDYRGGVGHLAVYDATTGTQVGTTVSHAIGGATAYQFSSVRFGNGENMTGVTPIFLENLIIDYTTHQWPMSSTLEGRRRVWASWR